MAPVILKKKYFCLIPSDHVKFSRFLADINDEGATKNASYAANLSKLEKFVMVKNLNVSQSLLSRGFCSASDLLSRDRFSLRFFSLDWNSLVAHFSIGP